MAFKGKSCELTLGSVLILTVRRCLGALNVITISLSEISPSRFWSTPPGVVYHLDTIVSPTPAQIETGQYYPLRWLGRVHPYLPTVSWRRTLVGGDSSTPGPKRCAGLRFHPGHLQQHCVGKPMGGCWQVLGRDGTARGWTRVNLRFVSVDVRG